MAASGLGLLRSTRYPLIFGTPVQARDTLVLCSGSPPSPLFGCYNTSFIPPTPDRVLFTETPAYTDAGRPIASENEKPTPGA